MRKMNNHADITGIGIAVGFLLTLLISVLIFFSIVASQPNPVAHPATGSSTYLWSVHNASVNSSSSILSQASTFYTIAPIVSIVIIAVIIIGYIQRIGG